MVPTDDDLEKLDDGALEAMVETCGNDDRPYQILAERYADRSEFEKALDVLDRLLALQPRQEALLAALFSKANLLAAIEQSAEAIRLLTKILTTVDNEASSPEALGMKGLSHYLLHCLLSEDPGGPHAEQAFRSLEELIRLRPDYDEDEKVMTALGDLRADRGDFVGGVAAYRRALEVSRSSEERHWIEVGLARVYQSAGDAHAAEQLYREAIARAGQRDRSGIYLDLGYLLMNNDRRAEARTAFESALDGGAESLRSEQVVDVFWHLAALAYEDPDSDSEKAREYLEQALPLATSEHLYFADIHIVLGHCYAERGELIQARQHYNIASFAPLATPEQIEMAQRCLEDIGEVGTA